MRRGTIPNLITHARREHHDTSISQLGVEDSFQAEQNVPLLAPVVGEVARGVIDHANADRAQLARAPRGGTRRTRMLGRRELRPVGGLERNVSQLQSVFPFVASATSAEPRL
jgi:hypothetical protein